MSEHFVPRPIEDDLPYLDHLGFVVVDGERPDRGRGSRLLVALRDAPTLVHFDPESIGVWVVSEGRGRQLHVDRRRPLPSAGPFAWGAIWLFDRLGVSNSFVTFGGRMEQVRVSDHLDVVRFWSPAPILRRAGHSQRVDPVADEVSSFFARLMIPIDFEPGAEARVSAASPLGLYAALVADVASRLGRRPGMEQTDPERARRVRARREWLKLRLPGPWREGNELLADLRLAGGLAHEIEPTSAIGPAEEPRPPAVATTRRTPAATTAGSDW